MKYEPPKTPAAHIPTHMVAPHGWDIVGRGLGYRDWET